MEENNGFEIKVLLPPTFTFEEAKEAMLNSQDLTVSELVDIIDCNSMCELYRALDKITERRNNGK